LVTNGSKLLLALNATYSKVRAGWGGGAEKKDNICGIPLGRTDKLVHKKKLLLNSLCHTSSTTECCIFIDLITVPM